MPIQVRYENMHCLITRSYIEDQYISIGGRIPHRQRESLPMCHRQMRHDSVPKSIVAPLALDGCKQPLLAERLAKNLRLVFRHAHALAVKLVQRNQIAASDASRRSLRIIFVIDAAAAVYIEGAKPERVRHGRC